MDIYWDAECAQGSKMSKVLCLSGSFVWEVSEDALLRPQGGGREQETEMGIGRASSFVDDSGSL